jgi:hypothetical protein
MSAESEASPLAHTVLITVAVLAVYVLSIGPVYRAVRSKGHAIEDYSWLSVAYSPLKWLYDHSEPAKDAFKWYLRLWST